MSRRRAASARGRGTRHPAAPDSRCRNAAGRKPPGPASPRLPFGVRLGGGHRLSGPQPPTPPAQHRQTPGAPEALEGSPRLWQRLWPGGGSPDARVGTPGAGSHSVQARRSCQAPAPLLPASLTGCSQSPRSFLLFHCPLPAPCLIPSHLVPCFPSRSLRLLLQPCAECIIFPTGKTGGTLFIREWSDKMF